MPAESGDNGDDSEARSRSHPLRRLIGPEPAAPAAPEAMTESDVPSLASVSIRRGAGGAKSPGRMAAQTPRQAPPQAPAQAPASAPASAAVQTQVPAQAPVQPQSQPPAPAQPTAEPQPRAAVPQAGGNGVGAAAAQAPAQATNGSGQPPRPAQPPSAPSQAASAPTPTSTPQDHAAAPAGGNGARPAAPESGGVSIRKAAPSIRKQPPAEGAEAPVPSDGAAGAAPSIRKPAPEAAGPEAAPSIRRPAPPPEPRETQERPIPRQAMEPESAPRPAPAVERTAPPVREAPPEARAAEAPSMELPAADRPVERAPAAPAEPPRSEAPTSEPAPERRPEPVPEPRPEPMPEPRAEPLQVRQPAPEPAPQAATAPAPTPMPSPPPINEGVFDEDGAMRIGYVISVSGRKVYGVMIPDSDVATEDSMLHLQEVSQIGDLVKMPTSRSVAFGMISSLEIRNPSSSPPAATDQRVLEIDLFGEGIYDQNGEFKFQRGISIYPSLGTEIRETTHLELAQIYAKPSESNVLIGSLYQDPELPAYLLVDDLLGKHFAVLGTTGTGKSCSTTVVLRSILDAHPNGHVVLLDPHNEYGQAFDEYAEVVRPDTLNLPFWLLNFEELVEVICTADQISRKAEVNILKEAVYTAKLQFVGESEDVVSWLTVDTPVPYRLSSLVQQIEDAQGQLDRPEDSAPYQRIKARIQALRADRRYDFMFAGLSVKDSMAEVLSRLLRIPVEGRPITILQLAGVPSEIVDVVVSVMCRMVFDFAMWSVGHQSVPVLLVCEEAHRYIPQDQATGFTPTRKAIARIAKEGRKYGVSLCLVTQRPSELSETILSQCNTIFTLRMSNERDQVFVRRAMPDSAAGMLNALPALRNQEAIVVGEGVTVPMRIRFSDLESFQRPQSDTAIFSDAWEYDQDRGDGFLHDVVDRWRRQSY